MNLHLSNTIYRNILIQWISKKLFLFGFIVALILFFNSSPLRAMPVEEIPIFTEVYNPGIESDTVKCNTCSDPGKNIVSVDILIMYPALGYSRIIQLSEKTGIVVYGSITPYFDFIIDLGVALTFGKNHHYFEPGGGYLLSEDNIYIKAGYRYQGQRGFVFRIAPGYLVTENVPWWTASFGFAF